MKIYILTRVITCLYLTIFCFTAAFAASEEPLRVFRFNVPFQVKPVAAESSSEGPQWLIVDLGGTYNVDRVIISWGSAYPASYKIEISEDKINWEEAYSTNTGRGKIEIVALPLVKAKYIKINRIEKTEGQDFSISEVSVYGKKELILF